MGVDRYFEEQDRRREKEIEACISRATSKLREKIKRQKELLKVVEWSCGELGDCFFCEGTEPRGHEKSCPLNKELNEEVG